MLSTIQQALPSLSAAERRAAEYLLSSPETFISQGSDAIADSAGVSKPTIVRLAQSLGLSGVRELKQRLTASMAEGVPFIHQAVSTDDSQATMIRKVLENTVSALIDLRNNVSESSVDACTKIILQTLRAKGRLMFAGVGNSGVVAQDAEHKFFRLGFSAQAISDGHTQLMAASMMGPNDCLVVISNSGRTRDLIETADIAKRNGAAVIVITATGSPLSSRGHVHLAADHSEKYFEYSPMVSRILHLALLDVLATSIALQIGPEKLKPTLQNMKKLLLKKRYVE